MDHSFKEIGFHAVLRAVRGYFRKGCCVPSFMEGYLGEPVLIFTELKRSFIPLVVFSQRGHRKVAEDLLTVYASFVYSMHHETTT